MSNLQANTANLQAILNKINELPSSGGSGNNNTSSTPIRKDVNFYDYDGTLLYSYTVEEAQLLTELPALPSQKGLICQGWNYDLETIKSYNRAVDVGATYITDDGKTRLYIRIAAEGRMTVPLYFSQTVAKGVTIDWGDGSATQTLSGTGNVNTSRTYAEIGDYVISLEVTSGTLGFGKGSSSYCVMGATGNNGKVYCNMLQKVEIGNSVVSFGSYAFSGCDSLTSITIPNGITTVGASTFEGCHSLISIIIPNTVTSIGNYAFSTCQALTNIIIPNTVTSIGNYAFSTCHALTSIVIPNTVTSINNYILRNCYALANIVIPDTVTSIGSYAFMGCRSLASITMPDGIINIQTATFNSCYGMAFYDFTSHISVPTLANTNAFTNIPSDCVIKVPAALYDEWVAATNWSTYASYIKAV